MAYAFSTLVGIDLIDFRPKKDRVIRALGFTHIAIDALVGNDQSHGANYPRVRMSGAVVPACLVQPAC